jgi:hypothetical protein
MSALYVLATTDAVDVRPLMAHDDPHPRFDPALCSYCRGERRYVRDDLTVTKHEHDRFPLGYLATRCPDHQQQWEAR